MGEPWDRPPFPKKGNHSSTVLYASIGRALMNWEEIEGTSAHLFSLVTKGTPFDVSANRQYGEPLNFNQRFSKLQTAMCDYFKREPCQKFEGEFHQLSQRMLGFSQRRNDVAHGRARWMHWVIQPDSPETLMTMQERLQWCVIPAHFKGDKFTEDDAPSYVLSSREINAYAEHFIEIARNLSAFMNEIENRKLPSWQRIPSLLGDAKS